MNSRFVNVLVRHIPSGGRSPFSLHRINPAGLFRPTPEGRAAAMEDAPLPPVEIAFDWPCRRGEPGGWRQFMAFGPSRDNIVGVDHKGRTVLYTAAQRRIRDGDAMPVIELGRTRPAVSVDVGGCLYVMLLDERRFGPRPRVPRFQALTEVRSSGGFEPKNWEWAPLPPPPFDDGGRHYSHDDEIEGESIEERRRRLTFAFYRGKEDPFEISSYAVVGGSRILVSTEDAGTYCFDTASGGWSKAGGWALPFRGRAEYVPQHGAWFGFSLDDGRLCATTGRRGRGQAAVAAGRVGGSWVPTVTRLLPLGSGKLCVARFFETPEERLTPMDLDFGGFPETPESLAVLAGVEVVRGGNADDHGVGSGLRMIKHRTQRYSFGRNLVDPL